MHARKNGGELACFEQALDIARKAEGTPKRLIKSTKVSVLQRDSVELVTPSGDWVNIRLENDGTVSINSSISFLVGAHASNSISLHPKDTERNSFLEVKD